MKKNFTMQILSLTVMLAFLCMPLALNAQGSKADFSGKWAFNAEKSELGQQGQGGRMGMGGGDLTATQAANLLTVERTRQGRDGQTVNITSKYTLDGKESVNTMGMGESKSTATWSADGKSLTIVTKMSFERDGQSMEFTTTEVWTLNSPASLTVTTTRNTPNGEVTTKMAYDKK